MGPDHLLRVRRNPFSESYRRYYFADVQAIVFTELPNAAAFYGYAAAALLVLIASVLFYTRHPIWGVFCALSSLLGFFLGWRIADCACYLKTSVSTERLPSLRHRGNAAKAMAALKAEVERNQGHVSRDVLEAHPLVAHATRVVPPTPALRHCGGQVHWILFAMMLVRGAMESISWSKRAPSVPLDIAEGVVGSVILLLVVLAAIQQHRSDLPLVIRRMVYVVLAWEVVIWLTSFAVSIYIAFRLGSKASNLSVMMSNPALKIYQLVDLTGFFILGCTGLILLWRHQRASRTPPPLAQENGE
jgi:hypothetical protein